MKEITFLQFFLMIFTATAPFVVLGYWLLRPPKRNEKPPRWLTWMTRLRDGPPHAYINPSDLQKLHKHGCAVVALYRRTDDDVPLWFGD